MTSASQDLNKHCRLVIDFITRGYFIPFLGAGVNLANRPPHTPFIREQYLPNASELSESIAERFNYPWKDKRDLLRVSWFASTQVGEGRLYQHLHDIFNFPCKPNEVHKFFAELPQRLAAKGYPRHQLIVTTNYDRLLESAFDEVGEPYDLLTYVAHSDTKDERELGKFKYIPYRGEPDIIFNPTNYELSIKHTIILKIHGAVDPDWRQSSFVITEDDYIDYLARMNKDTYQIPSTVLDEMLDRSFLFLGYSLSDWNLRVLLNSIRKSRAFKDTSWAIMNETEPWDETYWQHHNVKLKKLLLSDYIAALSEQLEAFPPAKGGSPP